MSIFTSRGETGFKPVSIMISIILFCFISVQMHGRAALHGEPITTTENGITVRTEPFADRTELYLKCFTDYNPGTSTYVFNNAGESGIDAGKVDIKDFFDKIEIQVAIPTLGSTSMTMGVFGKSKNSTTWGLIYDKIYTAITPTGEDDHTVFLERPQDFRIGTKVDTPGTDSVTITVDLRRDHK